MLNTIDTSNYMVKDNSFSDKIIDITNLKFSFNNKEYIFKDASLSIDKGDFVCILGKNGCGKSTLLKIILNLIKCKNINIKINAKHVSYVPQIVNFNRDFPITVKEFIKFNCKELNAPFSRGKSLCEKYELTSSFNSILGKLSGGQIQKLMLIRALLKDTDLLMVDEPTNNLDEDSKNTIYSNLKELNTKDKITIIVVEHNRDLSNIYANKVFLVKEGNIYSV